jgi:uncharacterized protein with HEPN domain
VRDPRERLRDALEAIANIQRYAARGRGAFESDELIQSWFVRQAEILGEAARGVPVEVRSRAPEIPWAKITGMRIVLVHGYFEIDRELVWDTVARDVPALGASLERLHRDLEREGP